MKETVVKSIASIGVALILVLGASHIVGNYKQAEFIQSEINRKIDLMNKINSAGDTIRIVNVQIRQQCEIGNIPTRSQQDALRMQARQKFLLASSGVGIIFDNSTLNDVRAFFQYDKSVADVCAKSVDDGKWLEYQIAISKDMGASIDADKREIAKLHGV